MKMFDNWLLFRFLAEVSKFYFLFTLLDVFFFLYASRFSWCVCVLYNEEMPRDSSYIIVMGTEAVGGGMAPRPPSVAGPVAYFTQTLLKELCIFRQNCLIECCYFSIRKYHSLSKPSF